jgi:hypothetical protein
MIDAIAGAASVHVLFWSSRGGKDSTLPFQSGVWVLALLQVVLALLILRRSTWARWLIAGVVVFVVGDSLLNTSLSARYESFPGATVRDVLSYTMQAVAVALLFTPASSAWFSNAARRRAA